MKKCLNWNVPIFLFAIIAPAVAILVHRPLVAAFLLGLNVVAVGTAPICKGRESVWFFALTSVSSIPVNVFWGISWGNLAVEITEWWSGTRYLLIPIIYILLLSAEQIVLGSIVRGIWRKQYRVELP